MRGFSSRDTMPDARFFQPGGRYRNNKGPYEVLSVRRDSMTIRYDDGKTQVIKNTSLQERIVRNLKGQRAVQKKCEEILAEAEQTDSGPYSVYVIQLRSSARDSIRGFPTGHDPNLPCVYVGQTGKLIEERFKEHLEGYHSRIQRYVVKLLPELYERYNPLRDRELAEAVEEALAEMLYQIGYTVLGGH